MSTAASAAMPDYTGCMVDGRFELVRMLGSGTYGVVYQAVDTHPSHNGSHPSRAIKMIRKAGRKPHELAAARREIALHSFVSEHPNIVTVHDAYEDDDYFYLILDFCRGGDLFEPICRRVYVDNDALLRKAFLSLIDALEACHSARVYHRDLKPENILVSEDRTEVYLADFGLATNRAIIQEFYCGTAAYMSPECIGRMSAYKPYYTPFSDVWSLGVILVNMMSGRNPWEKATLDDPCFIQFIENPDFLFEMLPISEGVNAILRRIFVLNPLTRITLHELRRAILDLDTFFRYEDELSVIDEYARGPAPRATLGDAQTGPDPVRDATKGSHDAEASPFASPCESGPVSMRRKRGVPASGDVRSHTPCRPIFSVQHSSRGSCRSTSSTASPSSSIMVLTPESTAVRVGGSEDGRKGPEREAAMAKLLISHLELVASDTHTLGV